MKEKNELTEKKIISTKLKSKKSPKRIAVPKLNKDICNFWKKIARI